MSSTALPWKVLCSQTGVGVLTERWALDAVSAETDDLRTFITEIGKWCQGGTFGQTPARRLPNASTEEWGREDGFLDSLVRMMECGTRHGHAWRRTGCGGLPSEKNKKT